LQTFFENIANLLVYDSKAPILFNTGLFMWLFTAFYAVYYWLVRSGEQKTQHIVEKSLIQAEDEQPLPFNHRTKLLFVTLFSFYFYYKSSGIYFVLLVWAAVLDFTLGKWIHRTEAPRERKFALIISVLSNLGLLFYFKYSNFFIVTINQFAHTHLEKIEGLILPVGISFFTFQSISYIVDIYTKKLKPVDTLLEYAFFVSFFPQLVAGPIVRAYDFIPQINKPTFISETRFAHAVYLIIGGLFKKAIIADYISLNFVDRIFENPLLYSGFENLMGVYGYALQIYCDFSGYSDMAIGIALLLGFQFPINFNAPYRSISVTDFWRRWHISLSTWLRDYIYIPLGGNRASAFATYFNLMATMLIGGFWHGAAWRFILWGALHGFALGVERFCKQFFRLPDNGFVNTLQTIVTFHFICFCWIYFRAPEIAVAQSVIGQIIYDFHPEVALQFFNGYPSIVFLLALGYILHFVPLRLELEYQDLFIEMPVFVKALLFVLIIWIVLQVKSADIQPFIYFQF
jgi:alginate O-acetyltransferase complex protein AlgI